MTSRSRPSRGFTLVEVLLAVAILAFGLVSVMVARARAVETAYVARNLKVARLLSEGLLGEIEAGLHEDLLDGASGDFAEAKHPEFEWRIFVGTDSVTEAHEAKDDESLAGFYAEKEARRLQAESSGEEPPAEPTTPVAVRVTFPTLGEERGIFTLEARVDTKAIDGTTEEEAAAQGGAAAPSGGAGASSGRKDSR
ncbi:MAG TPA: prepilin-type N-terminal cleavage/methylation domain-containing protein [Planctomycetota bacterium]|jgi:general secretion pathway protein I|nr:prepilin-type N-terminal cleavage/methylation domain-containing protein [Planctomycetota bacterium]